MAAAVVAGAIGGAIALTGPGGGHAVVPACKVTSPSGLTYQLSPEQGQNAAIIAAGALRMNLPDHAVTVALATALQESGLANLSSGDLDSVGLFQQRPSQGWGTRAQILDPVYATTAFYSHLTQVPGWSAMSVTEAAQAVQLSAAPNAYSQWEPEARALAIALTGDAPAAFACRLTGFAGPAPSPSALSSAATSEMGSQLLNAPVGTKIGWMLASWVVAHAWQYHIRQVSYGGWVWTPQSGRWAQTASASDGANMVRFS